MPFACIFVPDFPAEAIVRAEPELRSQPVAVLEGKPPLQKVFAVNENARRAGVEPGMTKIQLEPFTEIVLRPRSALRETAAHAALLDCAQSFSPRVENTASDTVILDLSGLESLFGALPKIARDIARRTSDLGLEANVATAGNPDTAHFAARGFSGVTVIAEGKEAERLGNLPLEVLFPELTSPEPSEEAARLLETFDLWGVRNFRALCALPEIAVSERLGQHGIKLQQLARGAVSRTLVPVEPPLVFEEAAELDHPLVLLEPLAFLLAHMLDQLCARLAARALSAQELQLQLHLDDGFHFVEDVVCGDSDPNSTDPFHSQQNAEVLRFTPDDKTGTTRNSTFTRTIELPIPMLDAKVFLKLLQLDLKAHPPGAPILKVHLAATPARPRTAQGGLFLPPTPEPEKLELTLARIAGIVGEDKVGCSQPLDSYRPDAFRMQRFVPAEPNGEKEKSDTACSPVTALRVFRPPLRANVTLRDGKPAHVICNQRKEIHGDILWIAGPWRSSGDWWEQDGWAHDEWDIATPVGSRQSSVGGKISAHNNSLALYRLVHDLLSGHWFVEGTYD
jgi:protein ImuB